MKRLACATALSLLGACTHDHVGDDAPFEEPTPTESGETPGGEVPDSGGGGALELHFVFLHGVGDSDTYARADGDLVDLEKAVLDRVEERRPKFESDAGRSLEVTSARFNLYTDADGKLASPGTDDGSQDEVASKWRSRLADKLTAAFPNGEKNIVLVGHSTGARAAMEVTADVGGSDNALGAGKYGFSDRVLGVVSIHGMIDALEGYETVGRVVPFSLGCKVQKPSGWCNYAANVSAVPAADWVATVRHALVLTSVVTDDRCGTSLWSEPADQTLPVRAQGNPAAFGLNLAVDRDGIFRPAHGIQYGEFCHSDITNTSSPRHSDAVEKASTRIATWLFESAPRVVNTTFESQTYETPVLPDSTSSQPLKFSLTCPHETVAAGLSVVGNCHHPGSTDGDDHAMTADQLFSSTDDSCGGTVGWKNIHPHPHSGTVWFKSYARTTSGVLATLL